MEAIRSKLKLEASSSDDEDSCSFAPYTTFNSLTAEDSMEQIRRRTMDINGDPAQCRCNDHDSVDEQISTKLITKSHCYKFIDIAIVVSIVALVWLVMSLPTVFYIKHVVVARHVSHLGKMVIICSTNVTLISYLC